MVLDKKAKKDLHSRFPNLFPTEESVDAFFSLVFRDMLDRFFAYARTNYILAIERLERYKTSRLLYLRRDSIGSLLMVEFDTLPEEITGKIKLRKKKIARDKETLKSLIDRIAFKTYLNKKTKEMLFLDSHTDCSLRLGSPWAFYEDIELSELYCQNKIITIASILAYQVELYLKADLSDYKYGSIDIKLLIQEIIKQKELGLPPKSQYKEIKNILKQYAKNNNTIIQTTILELLKKGLLQDSNFKPLTLEKPALIEEWKEAKRKAEKEIKNLITKDKLKIGIESSIEKDSITGDLESIKFFVDCAKKYTERIKQDYRRLLIYYKILEDESKFFDKFISYLPMFKLSYKDMVETMERWILNFKNEANRYNSRVKISLLELEEENFFIVEAKRILGLDYKEEIYNEKNLVIDLTNTEANITKDDTKYLKELGSVFGDKFWWKKKPFKYI